MENMIPQQEKKMSSRYKTEMPNEAIENQTKKLPNLFFLTLGLASMAGSLSLSMNRKKEMANFVGQWVPTLFQNKSRRKRPFRPLSISKIEPKY